MYVKTALNLWHGGGKGRARIGLLFGHDGVAPGQIGGTFGDTFLTEDAMGDIELLDKVLLRSCEGDSTKAKAVSCIVLGCVGEYVTSNIDAAAGYNRGYDAETIFAMLRMFLATLFTGSKLAHEELDRRGVSREALGRLSVDLQSCALAIQRAIS